MKSPYVNGLEANQQVNGVFLVQLKDVRQKKTGEPYLSLVLADKTGDIDAKMWDNVAEVLDTFAKDDFLIVKGLAQIYQNKIQITIHRLAKADEREIDFADFFPSSKRNADEMFAEVRAIVDGFADPHLKALLNAFFDDEEIARLYKLAPAAKTIHHAWLGGLIEHVLSMCALAKVTAAHYAGIDVDLLLTGVLLHDIGKIHELMYQRSFGYSDEGQLLGHIIIGLRMLDEKIRQAPQFPRKLRTLVEHMIVSHHGQLDFGSPKTPQFPEALLLSQLDNMDSKMEAMRVLIERDKQLEGCWTGWSPTLERTALKKEKYLLESAESNATAPAPQSVPVPAAKPAVHNRNSLFGDKLSSALKG
jgi:3'-5' exoribonuclease